MKLAIAFLITLLISVNGKSENLFSAMETEIQGSDEIKPHTRDLGQQLRKLVPVIFCLIQSIKEFIATVPSDDDSKQKFMFTYFRPSVVKMIACLESINHSSPSETKFNEFMQALNSLKSIIIPS